MAVDQGVLDAVASTNFKNVGEAPAFYSTLAMQNAVSHNRTMDSLREAFIGRILKGFAEEDPAEAAAVTKMLTGQDLAQQLAAFGGLIGQLQQIMKGAQTTPPETGQGG